MSDYIPLIVNVGSGQIQELPTSDNLDLSFSNISNVVDITSSGTVIAGNVKTDNYQYANGTAFGGTAGGSNTQIQFNNDNAFGGVANLTYDSGTGVVTLSTANVSNANVSFSNFTETANTTPQNITGSFPGFDAVNGTIQKYNVYTNFDLYASNIANVASGGSIVMLMNVISPGSSITTTDILWAGADKTFSAAGGTDMICLVNIGGTFYGTLTKGYA